MMNLRRRLLVFAYIEVVLLEEKKEELALKPN